MFKISKLQYLDVRVTNPTGYCNISVDNRLLNLPFSFFPENGLSYTFEGVLRLSELTFTENVLWAVGLAHNLDGSKPLYTPRFEGAFGYLIGLTRR